MPPFGSNGPLSVWTGISVFTQATPATQATIGGEAKKAGEGAAEGPVAGAGREGAGRGAKAASPSHHLDGRQRPAGRREGERRAAMRLVVPIQGGVWREPLRC